MRRHKRVSRFIFAIGAAALAVGGAEVGASAARPVRGQLAGKEPSRPDFGNPSGGARVPTAGEAFDASRPTQVIGTGAPAGCTSAAVVRAIARGGVITFNCGPAPVTITMTATAKVVNTSHRIVIDGGGKVTLSGAGKRQILYMNTCDKRQQWTTTNCYDQQWPELVVENMTFKDGNATVTESAGAGVGGGGGGAIFDLGGQLRVVNSRFLDNRCFHVGPDLGGAAIRALAQWDNRPVYITSDTFEGGQCSNGGALSSIGVSWIVLNSVMIDNDAIGFGANPASPDTAGGGSGGAIYCDGDTYSLEIEGTVIRDNHAREGGGAIFFVSDNNTGTLTITRSSLIANPSAGFWTRPYPGIFFKSSGSPRIVASTIK